MKINNKIKIPWYKRNVRVENYEETENSPFNINFPNLPKPRSGGRQPKPQPQMEPEPVRSPARVPVKLPVLNPDINPNPLDKLFPQDNPFGKDFPLPIPLPPLQNPKDKTVQNPTPQPMTIDKKNPLTESLETILKPILLFFIGKEIINNYIEATISDPIYNQMLRDPVLGFALREAEKSNLDMQTAANYFANYDYSNFNADQMTKELTTLFGAAAAARLIIFFIGRKVAFKI